MPRASADDPLLAPSISEADREPLFQQELLHMFRRQLHFIATLALVLLPFFTLIHIYFSAETALQIGCIHASMLLLCYAVRIFAPRISSLQEARIITLTAYTLFCVGASSVGIFIGKDQVLDRNQFLVYVGHNQILLSILLLPLSIWETLITGAIVIGSLALSIWLSSPLSYQSFYISHLFVLCTTAAVVVWIAHFQGVLRRRAFDAAFDFARTAAQLQTLSTQDTVTGGFNRRYLEKMLEIEITRAVRFDRPLSVLMFDLDNFKKVNDTNGHPAGDEVLREVWQATAGAVREIDIAARYGGDEFAIVLPETEEEFARTIAERLRWTTTARLSERFGLNSIEAKVTLSLGLVTFHLSAPMTVAEIMASVDSRLLEAKRSGKDRIVS